MSLNTEERFWAKVNKTEGCWLWEGVKVRGGYGQLKIRGKLVMVHRYAYEFLVGQIPEGLTLDHLCRIPACVNPAHLEPVTIKDNILRGDSFSAQNAKVTYCPQGHAYDVLNTYIYRGSRACRLCGRMRSARYQSKLAQSGRIVSLDVPSFRTGRD